MKPARYILLSIIIGASVVACKPDKQDDPASTPANTDNRDKYTGSWNCNETNKTSGTANYTVSISKSGSSSSAILISNFYGLGSTSTATANVSGSTFIIPYQQLGSFGFAAGSGTLSTSTQLNMTYTTNINASKDTCTASCAKL